MQKKEKETAPQHFCVMFWIDEVKQKKYSKKREILNAA